MTLKDYIHKTKTTQKEVSKKLGITQQSVSLYCNGSTPKKDIARKIISLTKGQVTLADLWNV